MTHGHGDDLYRYAVGSIRANFSSNICGGIDNAALKRHLAERLPDVIDSYPEPMPCTAEAQWAAAVGVDADAVLLTSGATDAIYAVAAVMRAGVSAVWQPTFSEYADACSSASLSCRSTMVLEDALLYLDGEQAQDRVLWLCNPNNPDGRLMSREDLLFRVDSHPDIVFVVDISYGVFCFGRTVVSEVDAACRSNLLLVRSLTKQFRLPGLRIGALVGCPEILGRIRRMRMPWSLNALAIEAVRYIVRSCGAYAVPVDGEALRAESLHLADGLRSLGIVVYPSDTHYMLCRLATDGTYTAGELKEKLAASYGLLIRDASNFVGLSPWHFRVAAQGVREDGWLLAALGQLLEG